MNATCTFCRKARPKPGPSGSHRACVEAYGLDYNPTSDADARRWLDARRQSLGQSRRWTVGLTPFQDRVLDLLHAGGFATAKNLAERAQPRGTGIRGWAGYRTAVLAAVQRLRDLGLIRPKPGQRTGPYTTTVWEPVT